MTGFRRHASRDRWRRRRHTGEWGEHRNDSLSSVDGGRATTVATLSTTERAPQRPSVVVAAHPTPVVGLAVAVVVGVGVGALTAYGQGWLSDATTSLVNSAGPWSVAAFLVARYNRRVVTAVIAATLTLTFCELGYAAATEIRGGATATSTIVFWLTGALIAGPAIGIAGAWSTQQGRRRGVGFGVLGGVLVGEGLYGWTTVADTTDWRYWAIELLAGLVIVSVAATRRPSGRHTLSTIASAIVTAAVVFTAGRGV